MTVSPMTVLVIDATGSIGRLVVDEALCQGHVVRALVRHPGKARQIPSKAQVVIGDVTRPETLAAALDGVDAIVLTLGADGQGKFGAEQVSYGGVRNVLAALATRSARIALMTAIGVTERLGPYNSTTAAHDWKRRSERLVRASGLPYTIVRPGWFDYNAPDQHRIVLLQGDRRHAGDPSDGVIVRSQIAQVLVHSLSSDQALRKSFELVAEKGLEPEDFDDLFASVHPDSEGSLDGVRDVTNMPLEEEPRQFRDDLAELRAHRQRARHEEARNAAKKAMKAPAMGDDLATPELKTDERGLRVPE